MDFLEYCKKMNSISSESFYPELFIKAIKKGCKNIVITYIIGA